MSYYLSNCTWGYDPDNPLFDSVEAALDSLAADELTEAAIKHTLECCREFYGTLQYHTMWSIQEVIDWDKRVFGGDLRFWADYDESGGAFRDAVTGEIYRSTKLCS